MAGSGAVATAYVKVMPSMEGVAPLVKEEFTGQGEKAGGFFSGKFGDALKIGLGAAAVAAGVILKEGLEQGAALEQSMGGIETLFGAGGKSIEEYAATVGAGVREVEGQYQHLMAAQETVFENAKNAYKTAGISANEYMETATSFAASLISSLGGDTKKAADVADMALVDMSDNANKMGTDMQSIQDAYKGFAKGQYLLLDNLKLGYDGTKTEMERLLADAQKLSGVEYDISSLADVYTAIHVIQEEMGIAGTTATEASTTVTGSFNSMKAAAQNVLGNLALGEPMEESLEALKETTGTFLKDNLLPMVGNVLKGLPGCIEEGVAAMVGWISDPGNVADLLGKAFEFGLSIIDAVGKGILDGLGGLPKLDVNFDLNAGNGISSGGRGGRGGIGGSFAKGLDYVPYDGFIAELHEGEMILTRAQANAVRSGKVGSGVVVNQYFYDRYKTAADQMAAARYEQEKAVLGFV